MKKIGYIVLLIILTTACTKSELTNFDQEYSAVNFTPVNTAKPDIFHFSFTRVIGSNEMIAEIPVRITGTVSTVERKFNVEVLRSTTTSTNYSVIDGVIPANSYVGVLKVKILNRPELRTKTDTLFISIVKNDAFDIGAKELSIAKLTWNDQLIKFSNWMLLSMFTTPYYSPNLHRALVAATGEDDPKDISKIVNKIYAGMLYKYLQQWKADHGGEPLRHDANDGTVQCLGWEITTL